MVVVCGDRVVRRGVVWCGVVVRRRRSISLGMEEEEEEEEEEVEPQYEPGAREPVRWLFPNGSAL